MTFTVTYRDRGGAKREEAIEAESRAACVAACRARGISPLAIREGANGLKGLKGVNGEGRANAPRTPQSIPHSHNSTFLLALALLALLGGAAWWWMYGHLERISLPEGIGTSPRPRTVKDVKPTPRAKSASASAAAGMPSAPLTGRGLADKPSVPDGLPPPHVAETPMENVITNHGGSKASPFRSATEQVMGWIFTCPVGKMPPVLPLLPEEDLANIEDILNSPNLIAKDDPARIADAKETVDYAKEELRRFLADGGKVEDFLRYYHDVLRRAHEQREDARIQYERVMKDDPAIAEQFRQEANKMLSAKGIAPLDKTDGDDEGDDSSDDTENK